MKNIKLKQTNLCFLVSLIPIILPAAVFFILIIIADCAQEESALRYAPFIAIAASVVWLAVFFKKYATEWIVFLGTITAVDGWKKDRRFYFTEVNGRTAEEAADAIKFRMKSYAKELETDKKSESLVFACKKRRHSFSEDTSGYEDYCILYRTQSLTSEFCSNAVSESKAIMSKFLEKGKLPFLQTKKERKQPVTQSCALVIVCDSIGNFNAEEYVRKDFAKGHTGLAVCIYDASTGRYFLNGKLFDSNSFLPEKGAGETAVSLIKKTVFCKKMGLSENSYFMPTDDLPYNPEMTMYDVIEEIKKDVKKSNREKEETVKNLKDGEVYFDGEGIFYKKDGRTLLFSVISEDCEGEEENAKKYVLTDKSWSYPKTCKMSKKDFDEALIKISEYLNQNGIEFEFTDFEKWLEQN